MFFGVCSILLLGLFSWGIYVVNRIGFGSLFFLFFFSGFCPIIHLVSENREDKEGNFWTLCLILGLGFGKSLEILNIVISFWADRLLGFKVVSEVKLIKSVSLCLPPAPVNSLFKQACEVYISSITLSAVFYLFGCHETWGEVENGSLESFFSCFFNIIFMIFL